MARTAKYVQVRVKPAEGKIDLQTLHRELSRALAVIERLRRKHNLDDAALHLSARGIVLDGDVGGD